VAKERPPDVVAITYEDNEISYELISTTYDDNFLSKPLIFLLGRFVFSRPVVIFAPRIFVEV
jgi:hypothetical protein